MIVKCKACNNSYNLDDNKSCPFCGSTAYLTPEKISELEQRRQDDLYERSYAKKRIEEQRNSFIKLVIGVFAGIVLLIILFVSLTIVGVNKARLAKYNNAITLLEQGDYENAIDSFKKAFEINPTSGGIVKHEEFFKMLDRMKKINVLLGFEK